MREFMTHSKHPTHHCLLSHAHRQLAYSQVGQMYSPRVLVCLPGLLETRATFDPLLHAAEGLHGLRVISIDHCGRGDSYRLAGDKGYCMSVYLQDTVQFLRQEVMREGHPVPHIELLGTSMGGILAMYLAEDKHNHIEGLFFNDIGLNLNWMSIYGLSDGLKVDGRLPEPAELAVQLHVSVGAVMAVSSPSHFDLPYRKDWKGMQFGHLLNHFKGPVRLVYGSDSGVCLREQVRQLEREFPTAEVLEIVDAKHPVPFTDVVNHFIIQALRLPPAQPLHIKIDETSSPVPHAHAEPQQIALPMDYPVVAPRPDKRTRAGLLAWIKQQLLGATKR
jgi:pimeloyl-ACP methyl ester carboxylesterase